jgi:uncharacterized membrane protein
MGRTRFIAQAGMIAALHAALSLFTMQTMSTLASGPIQFRVSETLTVLAVFTPAAIPGLTLGTLIANAFNLTTMGPLALFDVVFGSVATALGALWTWRFRERRAFALLGPVMTNALIVPAYLPLLVAGLGLYRIPILGIDFEGRWPMMYLAGVMFVTLGQAVVIYGLGMPLLAALKRLGLGEALSPTE